MFRHNANSTRLFPNGPEERGSEHPTIPDHTLLRCIGRGSYGSVWLAQNTMGAYRAVKVVYRRSFKDDRPFERELAGIRKFEPISRTHEGFVHVLHVGINQEQGYFYYVMELGDDRNSGQKFDPACYFPRTLSDDISSRGCLPVDECLRLGLALTLALSELHKRGLVHRDVKPSNIIFVNDVPKLADIGLVTEAMEAQSFVGTEGFIPPEGPGLAQADIYGLGKVLYEASTGKDRQEFPDLPTLLEKSYERDKLLELNEIILRACQNDRSKRYQSAWDMHADLVVLMNGKSIRRLKILERRLSRAKRLSVVISLGLLILAFVFWQGYREWRSAIEARQRSIGESVAYGNQCIESGDFGRALPYFAEAMQLDRGDQTQKAEHRLLFDSALAQTPKLNQMWFFDSAVRDGNFSPDGRRIIIPEFTGKTGIYDALTGTLQKNTFGSVTWLTSAVLSPDEQIAVTASEQNVALVWDVSSQKIRFKLAHPQQVFSARFSPDGAWIVTACHDGVARIWDVRTGALHKTFETHTNGLRFANFSHNGLLIVTAGEDKAARIWDLATGSVKLGPLPHGSWIKYAAFSPDDKLLVTAGSDRKARVWDVTSGRQILIDLDHHEGVECAEFSPDGQMIVTASLDGTARLWRMDSLQSITASLILQHTAGVAHATFSPDGHRLLTTCNDGTVRLWDLAGKYVAPAVTRAYASENGSRLASVFSNRLDVYNASSKNLLFPPLYFKEPLRRAMFTRNGNYLLCICSSKTNGSGEQLLRILNASTGQELAPASIVPNEFGKSAISDDGKRALLFGGKLLEGWDLIRRTNLFPNLRFPQPVRLACFDPKGTRFAVAHGSTLRVYDMAGRPAFTPITNSRPIIYATFSKTGSLLATCCSDDQINPCYAQIWNLETGRCGPELWHNDGVLFAAFSPDSTRLLTTSEDFTANIWDARTGKQLGPSLKHEDQVQGAAFSADGHLIATACSDNTVRIWSGLRGTPVTPPFKNLKSSAKVQFLGAGDRIITTDKQGNSWIWDLPRANIRDADAQKIALLLSGETSSTPRQPGFGKTGLLKSLWTELRGKYPEVFTTSLSEIQRWHEFRAEDNEMRKQWSAAAFHLQRLQKENPSDETLASRIGGIRTQPQSAN